MIDQKIVGLRSEPFASESEQAVEWLSSTEMDDFRQRSALSSQRRFAAPWLGGRWAAKRLVRRHVAGISPREIHVESRNGKSQSVRPLVFVRGRLMPWQLSIAHTRTTACALLSCDKSVGVGIDVWERLQEDSYPIDERRSQESLTYWFTTGELDFVALGVHPKLIWSLKEIVYKAVYHRHVFRPHKIDVVRWFSLVDCRRILDGVQRASWQDSAPTTFALNSHLAEQNRNLERPRDASRTGRLNVVHFQSLSVLSLSVSYATARSRRNHTYFGQGTLSNSEVYAVKPAAHSFEARAVQPM